MFEVVKVALKETRSPYPADVPTTTRGVLARNMSAYILLQCKVR